MTARRPAAALGAFALLEVIAGVVLCVVVGWSWRDAVDAFVVTNGLMGVTFGICGAIVAWHRPSNPIGWLFVADGIGHATTAFAAPLGRALLDGGAPTPVLRLTVTVFSWSWPWSIGLFLPLALLLFPDGRLPSPRWRPVALGVIVTAPLFALEMGASAEPVEPGFPPGYLTIHSYDALQPLWTATEVRNLLAVGLAIASLVVRYRRAGEMQRRQLLWLLLATIIATGFMAPWAFIAGTPVLVLLSIPLIPVAVTVAIVRYQLLDIRLVVSRALTWTVLTIGAVTVYAALVAVFDTFISSQVGRSAAVTVIVALLLAPVLPRLQRLVDRAMYGDRRDPARVASRVGEQLSTGKEGGLPGVVAAVREALRLPYVAVSAGGSVAEAGTAPATVVPLPLEYGGAEVGQLLVGLRPGESALGTADRDVLGLVAVPLAVAVHATALSGQLQTSRERIVAAREEERRRLRRDLHDGLGPALTGIAFSADAAANLLDAQPGRARELLSALRTDTRDAIGDVRRLVDDLRPPALDELGLATALKQRAEQLSFRADGAAVLVRVEVPDDLPGLPAAVEVAAYRIATEALTNVVRHSRASHAVLSLRCAPPVFEVLVCDDGPPNGAWRPGVGLQAMRERTAELGGTFEAGPSPVGGRVHATFPWEPA